MDELHTLRYLNKSCNRLYESGLVPSVVKIGSKRKRNYLISDPTTSSLAAAYVYRILTREQAPGNITHLDLSEIQIKVPENYVHPNQDTTQKRVYS